MATTKLKTGVTAVWGASEVGDPGYGEVQGARRRKTGSQDQFQDATGDTVGVIFFDDTDELEVSVICKSSMVLPARGAAITIATVAGLVFDWNVVWDNKTTKKITINAKAFTNALA
jgi:hypothetical protein